MILLLIATAISAALWAFERDAPLPYEAIAIFAVVLLNAAMGYVQESRAEAAVSALRETSVIIAALIGIRVLREPFGTRRVLAASVVALGVIMLQVSRAA